MSLFTARKRTASLLSAVVVASAMLASAAVAAPYSAGNSSEIPVVTHNTVMQPTARHRLPFHRLSAGNSFEIPLVTGGTAQSSVRTPSQEPFSAGNSFEIPTDGRM